MNFPGINKRDDFKHSSWAGYLHDTLPVGLSLVVGLAVVAANLSPAAPVFAQQSTAMTAVYGRGVHAYFAGNSSQAEQYFTQVIDAGSSDPRPYYFRAMLRLGMGRQFEAENDMRVGASLEARDPAVQNSIGRSLQRVQGPGRRTLENFRRQARLDRLQQGQQQTQQRYEQLDRRGPAVLRRETPLPLELPIQPPAELRSPQPATEPVRSTPLPAPPPMRAPEFIPQQPEVPTPVQPMPAGSGSKNDQDDLFGTPAPVTPADDPFGSPTTPASAPAPAPAPAPAEANLFDELPSPTPGPTSEDPDPFGDSVEPTPVEPMPVEPGAAEETPQPAMTEDDPFGESAEVTSTEPDEFEPDESDPFGDSLDEEMPADESADESADGGDPFGDSSATADEAAAAGDDPFGDAMEEESESDEAGSEVSSDDAAQDETPDGEAPDESPDDETDDDMEPQADPDDPFGGFGTVTPRSTGDTFATQRLTNSSGPGSSGPGSSGPGASGAALAGPGGQFFFALGQWIGSRGGQALATTPRYGASGPTDAVRQADFEFGPADDAREVRAAADFPPTDESLTDESPTDESPTDESTEDDPFGGF